jgi:hypothetical protein
MLPNVSAVQFKEVKDTYEEYVENSLTLLQSTIFEKQLGIISFLLLIIYVLVGFIFSTTFYAIWYFMFFSYGGSGGTPERIKGIIFSLLIGIFWPLLFLYARLI